MHRRHELDYFRLSGLLSEALEREPLIEAGEPLGNRYVVVHPVTELRPGVLFEVADHAGMQFYGQLMHGDPVAPALAAQVRQSLVALPALPTVLRPRDLALTSKALAVALLERPGGAITVSSRLGAIVESLGRREATLWLFRQLSAIANDLAQIHQTGTVHGAINASCLVCAAVGDAGNLQLAGFGIDVFARGNDPEKAPTRRTDLVALLTALQELFTAGGLQPEGGAAAKWLLLRTSAQHGEHPALASGTALAAALTEMASLRPDDAPRVVRSPTLAPPMRASAASRQSTAPPAPSANRRTETGMRRVEAANAASKLPPPPEPEAPPRRPLVSLGVVIPGVTVILAGVVGIVWYALHLRDDVGVAHLRERSRHAAIARASACTGENPAQPEGVADFQAPDEFDAVCLAGPDRVALLARKGTDVQLVARPAQRGGHYAEPQTIAQRAVELGSSLQRGGALWVAWRHGVGAPFGLARVEGTHVATVPVPLQGWDSVPLKGAWLLDANARNAWLVTNVITEGGEHVVLLQITFGPAAPDVVAWLVGAGSAYGVIAGESPSLLIGRKQSADASGHELTDVTLNLQAIAAARHPTDAIAVRGAPLPEAALTRSASVVLDSPMLGPVRHGVAIDQTHAWLVARGGAQPAEACQVPDRCHTAGPVTVLAFAPGAAPTVTQVAARGWAVDLARSGAGGLSVLATTANVAGAALPVSTLYELASPSSPPAAVQRTITTSRSPRARFVTCGNEGWLAFDATHPAPVLTTLPLQCTDAR